MRYHRASGVLAHITSLPGPGGIGDLGPAAEKFLGFLARSGQRLWQLLPVGPVGFGNSPYQSCSSFAGNPLLVSPELLVKDRLLSKADLAALPPAGPQVDFDLGGPPRIALLKLAFEKFRQKKNAAFDLFRSEQAWWLNEFCLFAALKQAHGNRSWVDWEPELVKRQPDALAAARESLTQEIEFEAFVQFQFDVQWQRLKTLAEDAGIKLIGDIPIFVAHDSADVWSAQDLYSLDELGHPTVVAGVPPDYFSLTGQLWGNPLYRWDRHAETGYAWWTSRLKSAFDRFDIVRIDHFRGFEAYWEVPMPAANAQNGAWKPGPGAALFRAMESALGPLPLIAEDLGLITPPVEALRDELGFPGMRVLQFAFDPAPSSKGYLPHNYPHHCVCYTGTHDNDTILGWYHSDAGAAIPEAVAELEARRQLIRDYTGTNGRQVHWDLIRLALASVADLAIVPLQDILGLGSEGRMNTPATSTNNWTWRFDRKALTKTIEKKLARMSEVYERFTPPPAAPMKTAPIAVVVTDLVVAK